MKKHTSLNKLNVGHFEPINKTTFKSKTADAVVLTRKELVALTKQRLFEEIPFIENETLRKHLPERYNSDIVLNDLKELSKFDHTLISNSILDKDIFVYDMLNNEGYEMNELILDGASTVTDDKYYYFISQIENPTHR